MTMIGTNASSRKSWRLGPGDGRRGEAGGARDGVKDGVDVKQGVKDGAQAGAKLESKLLAKSKASLEESRRMLSRQTILLEELRAGGSVTTEAEKSVARLEAALLAQRAAHDGLLAKTETGKNAVVAQATS